jgi:hypothetical protein
MPGRGPIRGPAPWKTRAGDACPHGREIYLVDGTVVRNHLDSDFVQGGNGYRYDFVPREELWVDASMPPEEVPLVVMHECEEAELMAGGMDYEEAHDVAKSMEDAARRKICGGGTMPRAPKKRKKRRKYQKLTPRERELASEFIPEEHESGRFSHEAAVAVGISRARRQAEREKIRRIVSKYL